MKAVRTSSFAAALAVLLTAAGVVTALAQQQPAAAAAAQPGGMIIGIVDDQTVIQNSKAGKALQENLNKQYTTFKAEIGQQETALRNQAEQLQQQQASLSPEAYQKKRQELDQQVEQYRKNAQNRKDQLDRAQAAGLKQLRDAFGKVAADEAKARGMSLVLFRSSVAVWTAAVDITPDVQKRFDQALPTVTLPK
jgi:Skp family chaperone for outer membrane proteins